MPTAITSTGISSRPWDRASSEPRPKRNDVSLEIPAKDNVAPLPPPAPENAVTPAKPAAQEAAPVAPAKAVTPPRAATPEKAVTVTPPVAPAKGVAPAKDTAPAIQSTEPKLEGFAVQVGAFRDEEKLAQAREKLAAARIPHFVERRGELNRLRAGPYPTREAAEKALAAMKSASLDGQVVALP